MNENERREFIGNIVDYAKDSHTTADLEDNCMWAMRVLWGRWNGIKYVLDPEVEKVANSIVRYAANCLRFCRNDVDFETLCNGLLNAYYAGTEA